MPGKLIRDLIPQIIKENGKNSLTREAKKSELDQLLKSKLLEETEELVQMYTKAKLKEEIVDVLQVLFSISEINKIAWSKIMALKKEKEKKRGGFKLGLILEGVK